MGAQESKIAQEMKDKGIVISYKPKSHLPHMIKERNQIVSELKNGIMVCYYHYLTI